MNITSECDTSFSGRMKMLKEAANISAEEFARRVGVSGRMMGKYLAGAEPGLERAKKIAEAMGVRIEWLVDGQGPMYPQKETGGEAEDRRLVGERLSACVAGRKLSPDVEEIVEAFIEVMNSDEPGIKYALIQNTLEFRNAVRNKKEIAEMRRDLDVIKRRLLNSLETDFKNQGQTGVIKDREGGRNQS
jgi:transcriptional regulator with XRE-family HTH domain